MFQGTPVSPTVLASTDKKTDTTKIWTNQYTNKRSQVVQVYFDQNERP